MVEDINMKKYLIAILALLTIFNITGCGGSSSSSNATGPITQEMADVRVNLTKSGTPVSEASVILYTESAALQAGLFENGSKNSSLRASVSKLEGSYNPVSSDENGVYLFKVPTGDYVLEAKTSDGSFMTTKSIRAAAGGSNTNAELTVTGTISGKVVFETKEPAKNAMVYLEKTSIVGITDKEGNFLLNNVPAGNTYNIVALINDFSNLVTPSQSVGVTESNLNVTLPDSLVIYENQVSTSITGTVKSQTPGESLSGFTVIAASPDSFTIGATNDNGEFALPISKTGIYNVMLVGSERTILPLSQSITVSKIEKGASNKLASDFVIGAQTGFGSVNGSVTLISEPGSNIDDLNIGKFLVRLIDSEGRYCYETTADYNIKEETGKYAFCFDNVAQGQYTVLVDPAGNGFFGFTNNVIVTNQKATDCAINVNYIVPRFVPKFTIDGEENNPWMIICEVANFATLDNFSEQIKVNIIPRNAIPGTAITWTYSQDDSTSGSDYGGTYCYHGRLSGDLDKCPKLDVVLSQKWTCPCGSSELTGTVSFVNELKINYEEEIEIISDARDKIEVLAASPNDDSVCLVAKIKNDSTSSKIYYINQGDITTKNIGWDVNAAKCSGKYSLVLNINNFYKLISSEETLDINTPESTSRTASSIYASSILADKYLALGYSKSNKDYVGIYEWANTTTPFTEIENCVYTQFAKDFSNNKYYMLAITKSDPDYVVQIYDIDSFGDGPTILSGSSYKQDLGLPTNFQVIGNEFYFFNENFVANYNMTTKNELNIEEIIVNSQKFIGIDNHGYYWWIQTLLGENKTNYLCKGISLHSQPLNKDDLYLNCDYIPVGIDSVNNKMILVVNFATTGTAIQNTLSLEIKYLDSIEWDK